MTNDAADAFGIPLPDISAKDITREERKNDGTLILTSVISSAISILVAAASAKIAQGSARGLLLPPALFAMAFSAITFSIGITKWKENRTSQDAIAPSDEPTHPSSMSMHAKMIVFGAISFVTSIMSAGIITISAFSDINHSAEAKQPPETLKTEQSAEAFAMPAKLADAQREPRTSPAITDHAPKMPPNNEMERIFKVASRKNASKQHSTLYFAGVAHRQFQPARRILAQ